MNRQIFRTGLLAIALLVPFTQLHAQKAKDAFIGINKKTLKKEYSHLAMLPVVAAADIGMPENLKQLVKDEVINKFTKAKFQLTPATEVVAIRNQLVALYPGGEQDSNRAVIDEHTVRELFFRHPVDGLLSVQITAVAAPFVDDKAEWGGTSQKIKHKGDGIMGILGGKKYQGHVAASAILVIILDRKGNPLFRWSGGIEVLMQRNGKQLELLPADQRWQNEKRVRKAARFAVKPI